MRVLVTGARGFVGRHVCDALTRSGFEVHAVSSRPVSDQAQGVWHRGDLLDDGDRRRVVREAGATALIHLAWCATPPHYWRDPANLQWLSATLDLVRAFADQGGTRIVATGSCAEYDWGCGYCVEGRTPLAPSTLYGAAKSACGNALDAFGRETGLSIAWARLFFLFGPHDESTRLVPSLLRALTSGEPARCTSGDHVRDFLYVGDAAAALVAVLTSSLTGPVNIASGVPIRVRDLAWGLADRLGRRDLLTIEPGGTEHALVAAAITRLREEVRWHPRHDLDAALDETIRWWTTDRSHGDPR